MSEQSFYPSCVVHLNLRFEKKLTIRARTATGIEDQPLATEENSGTFVMNRVPTKCSVEFQGHQQAATWKIVFPYRELPIDPRTIAACTAEIYLGTVSADEFAAGVEAQPEAGRRRTMLRTRDENGEVLLNDLLMVGVMDNMKMNFGESGAEVHLDGRDLRGIFLDSPLVSPRDKGQLDTGPRTRGRANPRRRRTTILDRLDTRLNIQELVQQIVAEHDTIRNLKIDVAVKAYPSDWPDGVIPSPGAAAHVPRHRRGAAGHGGAAGGAQSGLNFWDIITRYCMLVGAVPSFVGRVLMIRPGAALFDRLRNQDAHTPFRPNRKRGEGDDTFGIRRLVYGRDITSMSIERKYTGNAKPKTIRTFCTDLSSGRRGHEVMLEAFWPPRNLREARREGGSRKDVAGQESEEIQNVPVRGIKSLQQLVNMAKSLYEQIGRNEMKGEIETSKVTSFGGSNADPDVLRMRVGEPLAILVDASSIESGSPIASTLNASAQRPFAEAVAEVRHHLRDENLARVIVASAQGSIMNVLRYFYVANVSFDWGEEGVEVKADVVNYWTPRRDFTTTEAPGSSRTSIADRTRTPRDTTGRPLRTGERPASEVSSRAVTTPVRAAARSPFDISESPAAGSSSWPHPSDIGSIEETPAPRWRR